MKNRIEHFAVMRSLLFVPAHDQRLLASASKKQSDVLLLDLEDSVQPEENKALARENIVAHVREHRFGNRLIFPRVNDRESGHLLKDLYALTITDIDGFVYPKAKSGEDIYFIDKLLETIEYEKGLAIGSFKIIALIETASAVMKINEICSASDRLVAVAYGCEDFVTDLGGIHDKEGRSLFTPRAMIAMAAKSNGIVPIDTVHVNVHDLEDLEDNLQLAKTLGYEGMLILNPKEIPLAHSYFTPSQKEVAEAEETLLLAKEAKTEGKGVAIKNGKFIGPPIILAAEKVLAKQKAIKAYEEWQLRS